MEISDTQAHHLLDAYFKNLVKRKDNKSPGKKEKYFDLKTTDSSDFRKKELAQRIVDDITEIIILSGSKKKKATVDKPVNVR